MRYVVLAIPAAIGLWAGAQQELALGCSAAFSLLLLLFLRWPGDFSALARLAAQRETDLIKVRTELQGRIDLLSAEREISLILNDDVDFKTIIDKVLAITADTLGTEEVEIYLTEGDHLVPRAARIGGKTLFTWPSESDALLAGALETGRQITTADGERVRIIAPLSRDRELVGVARFTTPPDRVASVSRALEEFSKFLALAVKTPDLYTRAVEDGLTGLGTKRHFLTQLEGAILPARRYQQPLSLIMIDVDHFKKVNDTHGHLAGDRVLKGVADCIRKGVRRADDAFSGYRYGGEEMAVLLSNTPADKAVVVAERLRKLVEEKRFVIGRSESIHVTASLGVAEFNLSMEAAADLIAAADKALYGAKESGRNRVVIVERKLLKEV